MSAPRFLRLACLVLGLALGPGLGCEQGAAQVSSPADAAAQAQRRLKLGAFVRGLNHERYRVTPDDADLSHGASDPVVTIVEFVDYANLDLAAHEQHEQLERLLAAHPQDLRVVVLQHPGGDAVLASRAVLVAHAQGRGWAMHARLLTQTDTPRANDLRRHAAEIEVPDLARFERDMTAKGTSGMLGDIEQARRLGVEWRPTFFLNGVAIAGPAAAESLAAAVESELATARRLLALGARRDEVYGLLMRHAAEQRIEPESAKPRGPFEIPWKPEFAVAPVSTELLEDGVLIEDLIVGQGASVVVGKIIEFEFAGYGTGIGKQVMGNRNGPAKMVITDAARQPDPIASAMTIGLLGMRVGGKRRIKIPAAIVESGAPEGRPPIGDLYMGVELIALSDAPKLHAEAAFSGKPVSSEVRDDGLEIHDYRRGKGPAATAGMIVTVHYIAQLADQTTFDSSHARAEGMQVTLGQTELIRGFADGLEGARAGMLRKLVIPPELGYGDTQMKKIPPNSTLTYLLQIMDVQPAPDANPE